MRMRTINNVVWFIAGLLSIVVMTLILLGRIEHVCIK